MVGDLDTDYLAGLPAERPGGPGAGERPGAVGAVQLSVLGEVVAFPGVSVPLARCGPGWSVRC
jgi:hypothetical protein